MARWVWGLVWPDGYGDQYGQMGMGTSMARWVWGLVWPDGYCMWLFATEAMGGW